MGASSRLRTVALIGFICFGAALVWSNLSHYQNLSRLVTDGAKTTGQVTRFSPSQKTVFYTFTVGPNEVTGQTDDGGGYGNPEFSQLSVGQIIEVDYLPANPGLSVAGDPLIRETHLVASIGVVVGVIFVVFVALFYAFFFTGGSKSVRTLRGR